MDWIADSLSSVALNPAVELESVKVDNTSTADPIFKDARGRSIAGESTVLQAYPSDKGRLSDWGRLYGKE